jgi:hypothetical protein
MLVVQRSARYFSSVSSHQKKKTPLSTHLHGADIDGVKERGKSGVSLISVSCCLADGQGRIRRRRAILAGNP